MIVLRLKPYILIALSDAVSKRILKQTYYQHIINLFTFFKVVRYGIKRNQREDFYIPLVLVLHFNRSINLISTVATDNALSSFKV